MVSHVEPLLAISVLPGSLTTFKFSFKFALAADLFGINGVVSGASRNDDHHATHHLQHHPPAPVRASLYHSQYSTRSLRPSAADHPSLFSPTKTRHLSVFRSSEQAETKRVLDPGSRRSQNTPWMTSEDAPTKRIRQASLEIGSGILSLRFGCAFARAPADRLLSGARALRLGRDPPRADRTPPPFPAGTSRTNLHAPRDSSQKLEDRLLASPWGTQSQANSLVMTSCVAVSRRAHKHCYRSWAE